MSGVIGTCERCGVVDHHLAEGLCPVCKALSHSIVSKLAEHCPADDAGTGGEHQANDNYAIGAALCQGKRQALNWVKE